MSNASEKNDGQPHGEEAVPTASLGAGAAGLGGQIGPYKLLSILGEGGYGIVYLAERQRPVKRRVALKVIKPGMDTKQVIARFEAERQALALLDHPNIAHVFNAGTTGAGRPYFVMEYVEGVPISEHCDCHRLTIEERLKLFLQVCEAVQHAHQKGIIHRDIKPSNIQVSIQGAQVVPKVIDFGVAKAISQPLTERTLVTEQGQFVGTPEYMSPEQAEKTGQDIDTRSDIYSLGVVLYELLTGALPFEPKTLREGGVDHIRHVIREEDPKTPSTRVSTISGEESTKVAQLRRTDVRTLGRKLHGDLDWITIKAMEKDRMRRYQTAHAMAEDIQRHLNHEPVEAGPPSTTYRLRKFARRYRRALATAAVVAIALIAGSGLATWQAVRATQAMHAEAKERERANRQQEETERQRREVVRQLYGSLVGEARAIRLSRAVGYRREAWDRLSKAHELDTPEKNVEILRREAVRCMGDFVGAGPITWKDFSASILSIALHPQAEQVAVGLADGTVSLRSLETGVEITRMLTDRPGEYDSLPMTFGPDGGILVTGQADGAINVWEPDGGGKWTSRSIPVDGRVLGISTVPEGRLFVICAASAPEEVLMWSLVDGTRDTLRFCAPGRVGRVAVSPRRELLAAAFRAPDGTRGVSVWDIKTGETTKTLMPQPQHGSVYWIGFSSDGSRLVCACDDGVVMYDTSNFQTLGSKVDFSRVAAISPDNTHVAFSSRQLNLVRLWNVSANRQVADLRHPEQPLHVVFSKDGRTLVTASRRRVHIWRMNTPEKLLLLGHGDKVVGVAFSPNGKSLASVSGDQTLRIWNPAAGTLLRVLDLSGNGETVAFSPDGELLAAGGDGFVLIWETASWKTPYALDLDAVTMRGMVWSVAFSSDGDYLAAGGVRGLAIWHLVDDTEGSGGDLSFEFVRQLTTNFLRHVCFSPNNQLLAWAEGLNKNYGPVTVHVWDLINSRELPAPPSRLFSSVESLAFFPDSRRLAFFNEDRIVEVWDVVDRQKEFLLLGEEREKIAGGTYNNHLSLSPHGRWLAADSISGRAVNLWDTQSRKLLLSLPEQQDSTIPGLAWSPDNNLLAVARSDGMLAIWNLESIRSQLGQLRLDW
ncbi:MAG: protein kinase domain-containing protein [Planctomycetota bacterium]|jgi:WD40 repeat protein/serine/threonine protein kinase